ncbi:hypothetical protein H5410_042583 [Solanum commersonii]|uniref:Uncharacterized protein n=1 Tax=Solanum commersonii TaxID=4109 RepID=A0A9J5XW39_SOLCO|nr:hypothetical protein H5410_042583 [Solanum commersonii]
MDFRPEEFPNGEGVYQRAVVYVSECKDITDLQYVSTCNMNLEKTLLGATYALGQLDAHFGNFDDAEEIVTAVLKKAEQCFGLLRQLIQTSRNSLLYAIRGEITEHMVCRAESNGFRAIILTTVLGRREDDITNN